MVRNSSGRFDLSEGIITILEKCKILKERWLIGLKEKFKWSLVKRNHFFISQGFEYDTGRREYYKFVGGE
jgi:hypothetical protein